MANKARDFRTALGSSMRAEQNRAVDRQLDRFARAEAVMDDRAGKPPEPEKPERERVIRDSFTFPAKDYELLAKLRKRGLSAGIPANKSEILRAGLQVLVNLPEGEFRIALEAVEKIKTGRPTDKTM